jgi:hypothetical protein
MPDARSSDQSVPSSTSILDAFNWRGVWTPGEVIALLIDGVLNPTEVMLLSLIESAVKVRGEGCWISNNTFAKALGLANKANVNRMIRKLKKLDLVYEVGYVMKNNLRLRVLRTRLPECREIGKGDSFKAHPRTALKLADSSLRSEIKKYVAPSGEPRIGEKPALSGQFIPELENTGKGKGPSEKWDNWCAMRLRDCAANATKISRKYVLSAEGKHFRMLRKDLGDDRNRIERVLDFYCVQIGRPFVPDVQNAKTFRRKWTQLEAAYQRYLKNNPDVQITDEAHSVVKHYLFGLNWPKGSATKLLPAVQVMLDRYRDFRAKLRAYKETRPEWIKVGKNTVQNAPKHHALAHFLSKALSSVDFFVGRWFADLYQRVVNWPKWHGNLMSDVWNGDPKDQKFGKAVLSHCQTWGDRVSEAWGVLSQELS